MNRLEQQLDRMLADQASEWVEVMKRPTILDRIVFARWLKKDARHAAEFMAMESIEQMLETIDSERRHDVQVLLSASSADIVSLSGDFKPEVSEPRARRRHLQMLPWAAAAAVASISVVGITMWGLAAFGLAGHEVRTRIGEQRVLELEDGSTVFVNTQSRVRVQLSQQSRDIDLLAGEALFKVEPDPTRPFRVHVGDTTIHAIGTQFNVHRSSEGTQVAVIEGKVEILKKTKSARPVTPTALAAGEEASIPARKAVIKRTIADLEKTTAWRQRRLVFRLDALEDIAAEFNRYNRVPKIRVEGKFTRDRSLSGVFDADDPQAFAAMLAGDETLMISKTEREIIIRGL